MGIWGEDPTVPKPLGQKHKGDPRATEYLIRCPFCKAEFRVWLLPGDCIVDCLDWGCGKTILIEELLRPE